MFSMFELISFKDFFLFAKMLPKKLPNLYLISKRYQKVNRKKLPSLIIKLQNLKIVASETKKYF